MVRELCNIQFDIPTAFINSNYLPFIPRRIGTQVTIRNRKIQSSSETIFKAHQNGHCFTTVGSSSTSSVGIMNISTPPMKKSTSLLAHEEQKHSISYDENNGNKSLKKTIQQKNEYKQNNSDGNVSIHWHGTVTARILPRDFEEFHLRKPLSQIINQDEKNAMLSTYRQKPLIAINDDNDSETYPKNSSMIYKVSEDSNETETNDFIVLDLELYCSKYDRTIHSVDYSTDGLDHPNRINLVNINVHMNRDANEKCTRTLQRLEISTSKKLQNLKRYNEQTDVTNNEGQQSSQRPKKRQSRKQQKKKNQDSHALKSYIFSSDSDQGKLNDTDGNNNNNIYQNYNDENDNTWEISNLSSVELWRKIASNQKNYEKNNQRIGLSLSCPNCEGEVFEYPFPTSIPIDVISCPPTILSVGTFENFEGLVFVGVPLVVEVKTIFATDATITWFVDGEEVLRDSSHYIPTENDLGKEIKVLIIPLSKDYDGQKYVEAYRFVHLVDHLPFMPIVSPLRDDWVRKREDDSNHLRVLTYNILADLYASREKEQSTMYHHCELNHLVRQRRMPMIVSEILSYNADIICLQEVDLTIYETLLRPILEVKGYQGFYSKKVSTQKEGCAMFWSLEFFEFAEEEQISTFSIGDLFQQENETSHGNEDGYPTDSNNEAIEAITVGLNSQNTDCNWKHSLGNVLNLLSEHDELRKVTCEKTGQILQAATLTLKKKQNEMNESDMSKGQNTKPEKIVLANTHLFYHPMADHIRAIQAFIVCKKLDDIRRQTDSNSSNCHHPPYPFVFCGDLNSDPLSGAAQLLLTKLLSPEHRDCWKYLNQYQWDMEDSPELCENKTVSPPSIVLPSCFPNLVSGYLDIPSFTHFTTYFVDTLDYILASEPSDREPFGFQPIRAAQMPSEEEIKRYIAMPNEYMPSDHVSLVCDLKWKTNDRALDMFYSTNKDEMN